MLSTSRGLILMAREIFLFLQLLFGFGHFFPCVLNTCAGRCFGSSSLACSLLLSFWACIISCLFISASSRRFFFSSASLAFFSASSLRSLSLRLEHLRRRMLWLL